MRGMKTILALAVLALPAAGLAADLAEHLAARPKAYSVDLTVVSDGKPTKIHQAIDGDRFRIQSEANGRSSVMILDKAALKMVMLIDTSKMAMEMPVNEELVKKMGQDPGEAMKGQVQPAGSETIKGILCDRFDTQSEAGEKGTLWINQRDHTMVRWTSGNGKQSIDYDNYRLGAQPAELFAIPAGYKKMQMPAPPAAK